MSEKRRSLKEALVLLGFFIVFGVVFFFNGCALEADLTEECVEPYVKSEQEAPSAQPLCPSEDALFNVMTPLGVMTIIVSKNNFSEENHSLESFNDLTGWITLKEYEAWLKEIEAAKAKDKEGTI